MAPPNPSLQRTRQKRRAAELEYRWASLSAVTHFRLRSRVGCRSLIGERSLSVQCCREHQQRLVASALVPVKRGRRWRSLSPPPAACLRCPSYSVLRHHRRASPAMVVTRVTAGNQTRATLHSCGPALGGGTRSHRRSHAPALVRGPAWFRRASPACLSFALGQRMGALRSPVQLRPTRRCSGRAKSGAPLNSSIVRRHSHHAC